jgi:UDP-glucose 4-epimerase
MHVAVIGGAGYIGSHVVKALLEHGYRVTVFDNLRTGSRENLFDEARFVHGDILDYPQVVELFSGRDGAAGRDDASGRVDAVVHLAALKAAGESMLHPEEYARHNIAGTINILNAASSRGVRRMVFSSSAAVYGNPQYLPIDEDHPTQPLNFYGHTKRAIEQLMQWYDSLRALRFASLRYFNAAGYAPDGSIRGLEQNPANLLPVTMEVAVGRRRELQIFGDDYDTRDGTGIRDYVHVSDLAAAHVSALEYIDAQERSLTVNLGSETGVSVMEMLEAARGITGREIPARVVDRRPGDPASLIASSGRAAELLGWHAGLSDVDNLVSSAWNVYRRLL